MHLAEPGGDSLSVEVIRYQFPCTTDDYHDANWLVIRTFASNSRGSWKSEDPSLLTAEVSELAAWLEALSVGRSTDSELGFMEPNLSFELLDPDADHVRLRAYFELESRPSWAMWDECPARDVYVDLTVAKSDLAKAAESLRADLRRFPPRLVS